MPLSVAARQRVTDKVAKKWAERRKQNLMRALDDGWLVFSKGKPRERLAGLLEKYAAGVGPAHLGAVTHSGAVDWPFEDPPEA